MRCLCKSARTESGSTPSLTVTRRSLGVITEVTKAFIFSTKRTSRRVTIPTRLPSSTMGTPEILLATVKSRNCWRVAEELMVKGSLTTPLSYFLTAQTCLACCSILILLWIIPTPPSAAMAMARRDSVTVSIAAETSGIFILMPRVSWDFRVTSFAVTSE